MKKTALFVSMLAVMVAFTACSSDEDFAPQTRKMTISAFIDNGNDTRTALNGDDTNGYDVVWSEGDVITIGDKKFTLIDGQGTTMAHFSGEELEAGTYTAYFGTEDGTVPTAQTYAEGKINNAPMQATVTVKEDGSIARLKFTNTGGLLCVKLKGSFKVSSIKVGDYTLSCGEPVQVTTADFAKFYIAMPEAEYTNASVTVNTTVDSYIKAAPSIKITRSKIKNATIDMSNTIVKDSPVGTIGIYNGLEGIVAELDGVKTIIATKNIGAATPSDAGKAMSWHQAQDLCADGWRLASADEYVALGTADAPVRKENLTWNIEGSQLVIPCPGQDAINYLTSTLAAGDNNGFIPVRLYSTDGKVEKTNAGSLDYTSGNLYYARLVNDMPTE